MVSKLRTDDEYRQKLGSLVELIKTPIVQALIGSANVDSSMLDGILDALLHDAALLTVLRTVAGIMDCFNVDRFEVVADNAELERRALQMNGKKLFYAAVLFNGTGNWTDDRTVEYTLRMDIDNTPKTSENRNRFWFPGPEASFNDDMRYHRGFIEWQHAIDTGIIKMFKKHQRLERGEQAVETSSESGSESTEKTGNEDSLSFGDGFFTDDVGASNGTSASDEQRDVTEVTLSPAVESYLDFADDEQQVTRRRKRQFENLLGDLFGGGGGGAAKAASVETFDVDQMQVYTKMFPYPRYVHDEFKKGLYLANAVQVAFFFALLVQIAAAVRQRLWTKESGNRKLMQCMGLWRSSDLIAWSVTTLVETGITFLVCSVILYGGGVLATTSKLFMVFLLGLFAVSVLSFW